MIKRGNITEPVIKDFAPGSKERAIMLYLISADHSAAIELAAAAREIGGKPFHSSCWLVPWHGTADTLALSLRHIIRSTVVVCSAESDWSYR